jgi:hypothetical protein
VHIFRNTQEIKNIPDTISLLPLSSKEIPLQIPGSNLFSTQSMVIQTQISNQVFTDNINVQSFIYQHTHILAIFSLVAGTFIIVAILTWRLLVPRRRR